MPKPDLPPSPSDVGRLPPPEWERLQDLADRFENAWKAAGPEVDTVGLVGFLPAAGDPLRSLALGELIRTELEIRWRRGQFVLLEHYLEQFPELGASRDLSPRLIYEEYRIRRLHGDQPDITAYEKRFPGQYPEVQRLIQGSPTLFSPPPSPGGATTPSGPIPTPSVPSALRAVPLSSDVLSVGGGFRLIKRIGAGGFGEVWRAEAPGGVEVALKILSRPIDHAEAQRELESLELVKKLRHPLLLQIHAYWVLEDRLVIAMELADGSLRDRLKDCPDGVPKAELVRYFVQTAEALDFLHQQGVQHRDVKPDNILLVQRHVKVADFGLARRQGDQSMTASGSGSPPYMAPEVWRGKVTSHSDQYSLAVTYAELRRGRRPFSGREFIEMMLDHTERPPNLDPLPAAEQLVLQRALDKDPAKRFRTCADFVDELVRVTVASPLPPAPPIPTPPSEPAIRITENDPEAVDSLMPTPAGGNSPRPTDVRLQPDWRARPSPRGRLPMGCWLAAVAGALGIAAANPWLGPWLVSIINPRPVPPTYISTWIEPQVQLPAGTKWRAFDKTTRRVPDGRTLYQTLAKDVPGLSEPVVFRLVAGPTEDALVPPFYMMENKVSNLLFRVVAEDKVYQAFAQKEKARVAETVRHKWNENPEGIAGSKRDMLPVLNVTVVEAYCFAKSMGDECDLPTVEEWDKAAGCRDGHEGPYNPEEVAYIADAQHALKGTRADQPMSVNRTPVERSWSGCRDMAGNGCEWTRTPDKPVRDFPVESPPPGLMIYVCGRSYASELARPFRCRDDAEGLPLSYREPSPHVSFRVVARIPRSQP